MKRHEARRRRQTLQEELDALAAHRIVLVDIQTSENLAAMVRVADACRRARRAESGPDKQETPEVGASEVSTDRSPHDRTHDGRSAQSA
jgi:hypothetical protein